MKNIQFIEGALSPALVTALIEENMQFLSTGAYTIFCGQVRADVVDAENVTGIEYTIYERLAFKILEEQIAIALEQYNVHKISIIHSKGLVKAGGLSVILFITSSHRNQALQAQQALLPVIKFEVPIWKKELLQNRHSRWA